MMQSQFMSPTRVSNRPAMADPPGPQAPEMHRLDAQYILDNGAIDYKRVISERSYEDGPFVTYDSAAPIYELLRGELPWNEPVLCSAPASDLGLDVPPPGTTITEIAEHVGIRLRNSGWVPILLLRSPRCCCAPQTVDSNRCARSPPPFNPFDVDL